MRRILASHPDYTELNYLQHLLCVAINPHIFRLFPTLEEQAGAISAIESEITDRLESGVFRDFINGEDYGQG